MALADRALSRDPRDPEGWLAIGYLRVQADPLTYAGARQVLERAVELDSGNAESWHQYGSVLSELGDDSASVAAFRRALDIDPERGISWLELSFLSTMGRRYDESLRLLDQATAVAPELGFARFHRALLMLMTGDTARARIDAEWIRARGGIGFADILLARIAARSGDREAIDLARSRVIARADSLPAIVRNADADDFIVFVVPALLDFGERERALRLLESVTPKGRTFSFWLRWPSCDPLREEPRFKRLVEEAR